MTLESPDLNACDREPIRVPGSIQPHGALLAFDERDQVIRQASANAREFLGLAASPDGARTLSDLLPGGSDLSGDLAEWAATGEPIFLRSVRLGGKVFNAVAHRSDGMVLLEFETAPRDEDASLEVLYPRLRLFVEQLAGFADLRELFDAAAAQVRGLTGFDRVMVYRFDEDWNGAVIGEDRNESLPSYLDLRFPASDIPQQARELYKLNRLRIIPDAGYQPVAIEPPENPLTGRSVDLSLSVLRSVSPVHVEYMRNMGTYSSMSVSILVGGELWGLISCHHATPRQIPLQIRTACDFLAQTLALQIGAEASTRYAVRRAELATLQASLLARMGQEDVFLNGLSKMPREWLALADAEGAAVVSVDDVVTVGSTPGADQIREIVAWLEASGGAEAFVTDSLGELFPPAQAFADTAGGLLAIHISKIHPSYVLWFRPEVVRTVTWGGDPRKPVRASPGMRLHPRKSFETWREQVSGRSEPWGRPEVEAVKALRDSIVAVVLRQAEERAALASELQRSNTELEAFSYSVSHDLRAPFRHIVGYAQLLADREADLGDKSRHYLRSIQSAAVAAGRLVDDLLSFSQIGRATIASDRVDMNKLLSEARRSIERDVQDRPIEWRVGLLSPARGDAAMLRQALINLLSNAVKYSRGQTPAVISVTSEDGPEESTYSIRDNGVGFDMAYANKLFGVFQRLHRVEEFEGTGIGLAIARRVVERHGGRIWADSVVGEGATFSFSLPRNTEEAARG